MIKKGIAILSALSLLVMVGCTTGGSRFNDTPNRDMGTNDMRGVDDNYVLDNNDAGLTRDSAYEYDNFREGGNALRDGNLRGNENTDTRNNTRNNVNNMRNNNQMDWDLVDRIENLCEDRNNVDDATVAINDDTCYVGLDLDNEGNIPENLKEELSSEIKRENPDITKVYFTEDRGAIENFVDRLGNAVDVDWHELENIFR